MALLRRVLGLVCLCGGLPVARAGSLNAWGLALGEETAAVMPFVQSSPGEQFGQLYLASGLGARADINVGIGTLFAEEGSETILEVMPRVFLLPAVGLGIHAYVPTVPGAVVVGPEVHAEWSRGALALAGNVGWTPVLSAGTAQPGEVWAVFAPEVFLSERASIFVELDPVVDLASQSQSLTLVPGVGLSVDPEGNHSASLGVGITPDGDDTALSVGLAWTSMWSTGQQRRLEPIAETEPLRVAASADE